MSILEIGFGTGLNALLTYLESERSGFEIQYTGVDAYPIEMEEAKVLNYPLLLKTSEATFLNLHTAPCNEQVGISPNFYLKKLQIFFEEIAEHDVFDLIYFDAFGIRVQPELWTENIFKQMHNALNQNGVLVTYAANGNARRALQTVGFSVERLPGPPGKKEMLRGTKI